MAEGDVRSNRPAPPPIGRRAFLLAGAAGPAGWAAAAGRAQPRPAARALKPLLAWGTRGEGPGQLDAPIGLAISRADEVHVSEFRNDRVQRFSPDGKPLGS